tara:strand:- start:4788 stop:5948 length:1161 start_codon:yes stop_codon:yes gene_type:complete
LVFNEVGLSPSEVGTGIACAALAGTISRLITGIFLDKGLNCANPIKIALFLVIIADLYLFVAQDFGKYLQGQIFLGTAAGIYWPSIETAVAISCGDYSTKKGFSIARSADALGISIGITLGTLSSSLDFIRFIYLIDIFCMLLLKYLLRNQNINNYISKEIHKSNFKETITKLNLNVFKNNLWLNNVFPILIISLFATGVLSLLQSGLPLDLVKGGINRPPLKETLSGVVISIQLFLLLIFQWPVGKWLSNKSLKLGLRLSIICLGFGCLNLAISSIWKYGLLLTFFALISIAIGLTCFLPTATDAVIKIAPISKRGISMAMYSQCFGISALISPFIAGKFIEKFGNGFFLWLVMTLFSILVWPLIKNINVTKYASSQDKLNTDKI